MQLCPNCGHQNRAGIVFCENCGASLIGKAPLDTKSLDQSSEEEKAQLGVDSSILTDVKIQGVSTFNEGSSLRLEIEGSPESILFKPKPETIFGRRDPATGAMPDIDLTPFAGYRMGVSRRHAAIRYGEGQTLDLWDLGSSNGTFLNGQRLSAHRPYRMHDGDELRLGQMVIKVFFQTSDTPTEAPLSEPAGAGPAPAPESPAPSAPAEAPKAEEVSAASQAMPEAPPRTAPVPHLPTDSSAEAVEAPPPTQTLTPPEPKPEAPAESAQPEAAQPEEAKAPQGAPGDNVVVAGTAPLNEEAAQTGSPEAPSVPPPTPAKSQEPPSAEQAAKSAEPEKEKPQPSPATTNEKKEAKETSTGDAPENNQKRD
jgi:pSer/pThr/pTyr-binding forkhead associated (FHA) protein